MKVIASVTSDPKLTFERVRGSNINPSQSSFLVRTSYLESQNASYEVRLALRVLIPKKVEFIPGDLVEFQGRLINSKERRVAALLIADEEFLQLSKVGALGQLLAEIRSKFRNQAAVYESNSGALIPGMILGDTSLQSEEFTKQTKAKISLIRLIVGGAPMFPRASKNQNIEKIGRIDSTPLFRVMRRE